LKEEGLPFSIIGDLAREITCPALIFTIKISPSNKMSEEYDIIEIVKVNKPKTLTLSKLKKACISNSEYFKIDASQRSEFFTNLFANSRGRSSDSISHWLLRQVAPNMKGTAGEKIWGYICKNVHHSTEDFYKVITRLGWNAGHCLSEEDATLLLNTSASSITSTTYSELMRILLEVVRHGDNYSDGELKEMMNEANGEFKEQLSIDLPRVIQAGVIYRTYTESVTTFNNTCLIEGTHGPRPTWMDESCDILAGTGLFNIRSNILVRMRRSDQSVRVIEEKSFTSLQADVCKYLNGMKQVFVYHVDNDLDIKYYQKLYDVYSDQPQTQDIQVLTAVKNRTLLLGPKVTCIVNSITDLGSFPSIKTLVVDRTHALDLKQIRNLFRQYPRVSTLHLFGNKYTQPDGPGNPFYDIWKSGRFINTNLVCNEMQDPRFKLAQFIATDLDRNLAFEDITAKHILLPVKKSSKDIPEEVMSQTNSVLTKMGMNHQLKLDMDSKRKEAVVISLKGADKDFLIRCMSIIPVGYPSELIIVLGSEEEFGKAIKNKKERRMTSLIHDLAVTRGLGLDNNNIINKVK
jgi:hypothetical protein